VDDGLDGCAGADLNTCLPWVRALYPARRGGVVWGLPAASPNGPGMLLTAPLTGGQSR
jgi:hypothetical protein